MTKLALACIVLLACACQSGSGAQTAQPVPSPPALTTCAAVETDTFIAANHERYANALARARAWLDALAIDPIELRRHGVKGKKKLTEQLDAYHRLYSIADPDQKPALLDRIRQVVAITSESRFHDMAKLSDRQFKQDATSYLRAAVMMERLGLDTDKYRDEIAKIKPRLDAHMRERGPHQRLAFHWYYRHFGLAEPFPLGDSLEHGLIARRAEPAKLSRADVYDLTHEVFVPYEFGDKLDVDPFDADTKAYLRRTLSLLLARFILERDADLAAELVSCMRFLRFDEPVYREGLEYLLDSQHEDGSWGDRERARREFGDQGREAILLHTTMVAIEALTIAFHRPWNPPRSCTS